MCGFNVLWLTDLCSGLDRFIGAGAFAKATQEENLKSSMDRVIAANRGVQLTIYKI